MRLRGIARLSRADRHRRQRAGAGHLPRLALSGRLPHGGRAATPPVTITTGFPAGSPLAGAPVPAGTLLHSRRNAKAQPALANTWTWFSLGDSSYNALQVDLNHRFSHGLSLRGVYTWSKALDDGDSLNQTTAGNAPGLVSNPYNMRADWGPATYDVRNIGVISAVYELPFGKASFRATARRLGQQMW